MDTSAFGPWIVERPIGRGAHATVYRCHHRDDAARVAAVKVLHGAEPRLAARFAREVRILRRLDHPGIVGVLDADPAGPEPWVALDLVDGIPLDRTPPGPRAPAEVAAIARQVGAALAHAHAVGVFHRDVKPGNLIVARGGGRVRVVDFGISAARGEATLTAPGTSTPGTVDYAPPEWFRADGLDPARLDAYAFGVVLHELLTGARAFPSSPGVPLGRLLARKNATPELDPGPDVPEPLRGAVRALTAADPRRRATIEDALPAFADPGVAPAAAPVGEVVLARAPADAFVGREDALALLRGLPPTVRLVTLSGPPGVGKSRLAREWCAGAGPTPWVELGEATDLSGALVAAGRALACRPTLDAVTAALRAGAWPMVLLDDADRALDALRTLLPVAFRETPQVRWVLTTRGRLRIGGERVVSVEPLPVPVDTEPTAAVALLTARTREAGAAPPDPATAAATVRALDGLPLAIEVAATGPLAVPVGEGGLADVLSAAWERLDDESRRVLSGCAVFRAPFPLPLAEDVVGAGARPLFESLQALVDQSWLQVRRGEGAFSMLRPLRDFALQRLADPSVRERHAFAAARPADLAAPPGPADVANAFGAWSYAEEVGDPALAVLLALVVARGTVERRGGWVERARALLSAGAGTLEDRDRLRAALGAT